MIDDLFGEAYARATDPDTSHAAAESMKPEANRLEQMVVDALAFPGTCSQIASRLGMAWNTVSPRLAPLRRKGIIKPLTDAKGNIVKKMGPSRRKQIVWVKS